MNPDKLEHIPMKMEKMFYELQSRIMEDVVRRIKKTGKITATADYQLNRMQMLGESTEFLESEIKRLSGMTDAEIWEIYDQVINDVYTRNTALYEQINREFVPYEENELVQGWVDAVRKQTKNELINITASLGFMVDYGTKKVFTPMSEYYQKYLDRACMDIVTGAFDYGSVLRRVVREMTASDIRTVDYASGYSSRAVVAARRAVLTGVHQLSGKINEQTAKELGTDKYETTWHSGHRPDHWWGGQVYTRKELEDVCGLGRVDGLCGANCRHSYFPFVEGASIRNYTDEQLAEMEAKEQEVHTFMGKPYNAYEATQMQRKMEAKMRRQREDITLLKKGDGSLDDIIAAQARYQNSLHQYQAFAKKMGLEPQMERVYMDGLGRVAPGWTEKISGKKMAISIPNEIYEKSGMSLGVKNKIDAAIKKLEKEYTIYIDKLEGEYLGNKKDIFLSGGFVDRDGVLKHAIVFNYDINYDSVERRMKELYNSGVMAGKSYEDYLAHEVAHILPFQNCITAQEYNKLRKELKQQFIPGVSGYADRTKDGAESLAEAFVKYRNGEEISNDARKLIHKYITPWRR